MNASSMWVRRYWLSVLVALLSGRLNPRLEELTLTH